ncbi:putative efflux pump antibiotic resistance protein [Neofusicoccum parvum UCRNP2]|uniref:Putative efflux pump antibiotic resistance protein n=1 Tax=Botryosphaeria parva (strain UCR-NP2) TaxID=1287680 RepID=R1EC36_BOTPV|nr:putative efflux pump antibiotic resistance protein [Neofusicoccum parvum UCRNP2]
MDSSEKLQPPSPADRRYLRSWRLAVVIASLCLGTFLVALDINIIGTAVPRITSDFDSLNDLAWYGSAYLLTVTALQPALGTVYKFFDVKATYLTSIVLFEVK